jgi:monoterpene epsilon-lactone hydrolase
MSKVIKIGFKAAKIKENWKNDNPDFQQMRRRSLSVTELEAHRNKYRLVEVANRKCFYKNNHSKTLVIWLHGGGYVLGPFKQQLQRLRQVCDHLAVDGILPDYPKAPEFNYKDNLEFLMNFYHEFIEHYDNFYLLGDSAGGGLALGFSLLLQQKGLKTPKSIYTFSPWLDLTNSMDISEYDQNDPFLAKKGLDAFAKYYGVDNLKSPFVSPYYGDYSSLESDIYVYSGTHEIFHPTAVEFAKKHEQVVFRTFENMIHAWALMPIPEATQVIDEVIESIESTTNADQVVA